MKRMKKLTCLVLSILMLLPLIAACGGGKAPAAPAAPGAPAAPAASAAPAKDTITFAYVAEASTLSTTGQNEIGASYICRMIYSGLFKNTASGIVNDLCTEYHTEKDANGVESIWVFKLREGVKFSDGTPLTADDVVDSLTFAHDQTIVKSLTTFFTKVEKVDDYTVKLYTDGVYATVPYALSNTACFIVPSELLANGHDFGNNPIGSGPYKLVKWNKGENLLLTANENYYGNAPAIKNVNWKIIAEGTSRTLALESGEADFIIDIATLDINRIKDNSKFALDISNGSMFTYLLLQRAKEPFNDINFRKFLAAAINRDDVVSVAVDGYGTGLNACINVNIDGSTDENATTYNPDKAKEYLAAWGGDPASVNFELLATNDIRRRVAENIQNSLKMYGVNCTVSNVESATGSSLARAGDFEAMVFAYTTDDFATYAKNLYYMSDSAAAANKWRMDGDDSLNPLLDEIFATTDTAKRKTLITEFTAKLNEKQPVVPLYCNRNLIAYDKNISGVEVSPRGYFYVENFSWN